MRHGLPGGGTIAQAAERLGARAHRLATGRKHHHLLQAGKCRTAALHRPAGRQFVQKPQVVEAAKAVHGDQQHGVGLAQHVAQFVAPVEKVDRHCHRPDARDGEFDGYELRVIGHQHRYVVAWLDAGGQQAGSQPL